MLHRQAQIVKIILAKLDSNNHTVSGSHNALYRHNPRQINFNNFSERERIAVGDSKRQTDLVVRPSRITAFCADSRDPRLSRKSFITTAIATGLILGLHRPTVRSSPVNFTEFPRVLVIVNKNHGGGWVSSTTAMSGA